MYRDSIIEELAFLRMETYSDHSAILDYLAQVEQEEQLRESLKSKSGIAALRVEKGEGPGINADEIASTVNRLAPDSGHRHRGVCSLSRLLECNEIVLLRERKTIASLGEFNVLCRRYDGFTVGFHDLMPKEVVGENAIQQGWIAHQHQYLYAKEKQRGFFR